MVYNRCVAPVPALCAGRRIAGDLRCGLRDRNDRRRSVHGSAWGGLRSSSPFEALAALPRISASRLEPVTVGCLGTSWLWVAKGGPSTFSSGRKQPAVTLYGFSRRQLCVDAMLAGVGRGDDARRCLFDRDGDACRPDRRVEICLVVGVGGRVEQGLLLAEAVLDVLLPRIDVRHGLFEAAQRFRRDVELSGDVADVCCSGLATAEMLNLAVFVEVVDSRNPGRNRRG